MRVLSAILGLIILTVVLVFALANRQGVIVSFWPFGFEAEVPLCLVALGALAAGLLFGGLFVWFGTLPHRWRARRFVAQLGNRIVELERELERNLARPKA